MVTWSAQAIAGVRWSATQRAQGWFVIEVGGLLVGVYTSCSIRPRDIRGSFGHYRLPLAAFSCPLDPINSPRHKLSGAAPRGATT